MTQSISSGPDKVLVGVWTLLASPPALMLAAASVKSRRFEGGYFFLLMLAFAVLPVLFASRFRVTFTATEFVYRRWGPTIRVPYDEIYRIEVANEAPISGQAIGAFIVSKDGKRFPFWPKLFPRDVVRRFFELAPRR